MAHEKGGYVQNSRIHPVLLIVLSATLASCGKSAVTLEQECAGGGSSSCYAAGEMYLAGSGLARDSDKAVQLFERACEGRDSKGCAKATEMFQRACETGRAMACTMLGAKYLDGFGVPPDSAKAATLFEAACNQNEPVGCSNLAMLYSAGGGVARDPGRAAQLWRKACQQGYADACQRAPRQ